MSRIILSKYDDGREHIVVGWDHPARGAFWQEWASASEIKEAEKDLAVLDELSTEERAELYRLERIAETGIKGDGGIFPGIPLDRLVEDMPKDLRHLMTTEVLELLYQHAGDPDSGYDPSKSLVDLSGG